MKISNILLATGCVFSSACSDQQSNVHYGLPEDKTYYKIQQGDTNQFLAELYSQSSDSSSTTGFPTYDISQSWDRNTTSIPLSSLPSGIELSNLIRQQVFNDIPGFSDLIKTQFFRQAETGELYLIALQQSDSVYWIKNSSTNEYGLLYLPANPAEPELSISESGSLQICNPTCVDSGDVSYTYSYISKTTRKTIYATFDTLVLRTVLNVNTVDSTNDVSYQLDTQSFYTPLAGNIAEAVSFNNGSSLGEYSAILSKTNIKIDKQYIVN